jgi:hypothetical protein
MERKEIVRKKREKRIETDGERKEIICASTT